jgi:tetratricopeptide (TPR) repeat protein
VVRGGTPVRLALLLFLGVLGAGSRVDAGDLAPMPEEGVATSVLQAHRTSDVSSLSTLAAASSPDPWLVVDVLLGRSEGTAAIAFAERVPGRAGEALRGFTRKRASVEDDRANRALVDEAETRNRRRDREGALRVLRGIRSLAPGVVAVRAVGAKALALRALGRHGDAAGAFSEAARIAADIGWTVWEREAWYEAGNDARTAGNAARAADAYERSVLAAEASEAERFTGTALVGLGRSRLAQGRSADARAAFERALSIWIRIGERGLLAVARFGLGTVEEAEGNLEAARAAFTQASADARAAADPDSEAKGLRGLGDLEMGAGHPHQALVAYRAALAVEEARGDVSGIARSLAEVARALRGAQRFDESIEAYEKSLTLRVEKNEPLPVARIRLQMARVRRDQGKHAAAIRLLESVLASANALHDSTLRGEAIAELAVVYKNLGDLDRARDLVAERLRDAEESRDPLRIADALEAAGNLEFARFERGHDRLDLDAAFVHHRRALELRRQSGLPDGIENSLANLAMMKMSAGDDAGARTDLEEVLAIQEKAGHVLQAARTRMNLGVARAALGDMNGAEQHTRMALATAAEHGAAELESQARGNLAALLLDRGQYAEAVVAAREAMVAGRVTITGLGESEGTSARGARVGVADLGASAAARAEDAEGLAFFLESARAGALLEELHLRESLPQGLIPAALEEEVRGARAQIGRASARLRETLASGERTSVVAARRSLEDSRSRLAGAIARVQREARDAAHLVYPEPDSLGTISSRIGPAEVLVLYGLLRRRGACALVVRKSGSRIVSLGPAEEIERAVAAIYPADESGTSIHLDRRKRELLRDLLLGPLGLTPEDRRVLVSPDGAVAHVPFAWLLPECEVAYVPSGTVLGHLVEGGARHGEGVLALGDPKYGAPALLSSRLRSGRTLAPLPATREEVAAVADVALLGEEATPRAFRIALATRPRWRAVHFACHGLFDAERPRLSGLALTPTAEDDGTLTALDVISSRIDADLAVLSACETARGAVVRGEGAIGLVRAFFFAGTPRVLASLWKVDDEATRVLMTRFYAAFRRGRPAAAALREAQESLRKDPRWSEDTHWAAWVLWGLPS